MTKLEQIRHGYNDGQTIFRRQSVEVLLARIEELEQQVSDLEIEKYKIADVLETLLNACEYADMRENLSDDISGDLLNETREFLDGVTGDTHCGDERSEEDES